MVLWFGVELWAKLKPSVTLWWWKFIVFLPLLLMTRLLSCFLNIWTLMLQIVSTVSKSFSASDSLKNEPGKQLLMIIVSEYAGKLPIRLIPLWLNMPKEIKRAEWRKKRECWSICHLICTYAIAGCHSTKMLIRFAALLLRIKIFFITFYDAEVFFMWIILYCFIWICPREYF